MANKIYLGTTEVANVGSGGGGGGDYVLNSSFDEMTRVAASALVELKKDKADRTEIASIKDVSALQADISVLRGSKADASTVYVKEDIDKSDKVVAAALASQDSRIIRLDASVNALEQGGGGGGITPAQLDASLKAYTYDKAHIDASISAIEPVVSFAELDASLKAYTYDKAHIDASYGFIDASVKALDASALYFDASIKELAQGGGGGSEPGFVKQINSTDSTKVGLVSSLRTAAANTSIGNLAVVTGNGIASGDGAFSTGNGIATGVNSVALGLGTVKSHRSFATAGGTCNGQYSMAVGSECVTSNNYSIAIGRKCKASTEHAFAEGYDTTA